MAIRKTPPVAVAPHFATALAWAALDVSRAKGKALDEARRELGQVLVAINGAPLTFRGPLNPDGPAWDKPQPDPVVTEALRAVGHFDGLELLPARKARVRCEDPEISRNVSFVHWSEARGWACVLADGTPAAMSYAGIPYEHETLARFKLDDCRTAGEVLHLMQEASRYVCSLV